MTKFDLSQGTKISNARVDQILAALTPATDTQHIEHRPYLVKSWLDLDATSLVYGQSNTGKSFLTLDVAFHVAAGWYWNSCRVTQSNVIYVAAEGGTGFSTRISAIATGNPDLFETGKEHFHHLPLQLDLHGEEDVEALLTAIAERPVDLLIIDTLAMSFGAGNENEGKDVTQFLTHIAEIRQTLGCHVMLVHHSGKDQTRGARGHSSLRAAVDTEIEVSVDGLMHLATTRKQRDLEGGKIAAFTLNVVTLGLDPDGEPMTSCTVQP
jgi:RecA-family ATPase